MTNVKNVKTEKTKMAKDLSNQTDLDIEVGTGFSTIIREVAWNMPTEAEVANGEGFGPEFPDGTYMAIRMIRDNNKTIEERRTDLWILLGYFDDITEVKVKTKDKTIIDSKIYSKFLSNVFTSGFLQTHGFSTISGLETYANNNKHVMIRTEIEVEDDMIDEYDTYLEVDLEKLKSK